MKFLPFPSLLPIGMAALAAVVLVPGELTAQGKKIDPKLVSPFEVPKVFEIKPGDRIVGIEGAVPVIPKLVSPPDVEIAEAEPEADTETGRPPGLPPVAGAGEEGDGEMRMIVRLRDGTIIMGKPLTTDFPIETPYGELLIPLTSLRSATFGLRIPEEATKAAEEAIKQLGGSDFKLRDRAQAVLRNMGESGLSAIQAALESGVDLETQKRLKAVMEEVAPEGIESLLMDSLSAGNVRASGKITIDTLEVECSLGKLAITLDKLREIRSLGGTAFSENFENFRAKSANWETQASNNTTWQVEGRRAKDGKSAMWCGVKGGNQYSDNANATLTSPPIDLSKLDSPVLQFSYWLKMEDGADTFSMEMSRDGGSNWEGSGQYSSNGSWAQQRVDLSGFRSHNFRFRFRFQSDGSSVDEGAFLDGFTVGEADELE